MFDFECVQFSLDLHNTYWMANLTQEMKDILFIWHFFSILLVAKCMQLIKSYENNGRIEGRITESRSSCTCSSSFISLLKVPLIMAVVS